MISLGYNLIKIECSYMDSLFEIQRIIIEQFEDNSFYWRTQFDAIIPSRNILGIIGSRLDCFINLM